MIQAFYMDRCHFCPSPESPRVVCRSIQRKVKDFFSFFTCSMSVMAESLKQFFGKEAVPIFGWTQGVPVEEQAMQQLKNIASLPFIHKHVAVMPDVHLGKGATIGSVIPTKGAIVPAAVGVDLGCGMMAVRTSIRADHLPDSLAEIRSAI